MNKSKFCIYGLLQLDESATYYAIQTLHSEIPCTVTVGNMALLPLRTKYRGPAPITDETKDIISEALYYFKSLIFFRNYEVKCQNKISANKELAALAISRFDIPGDPSFPKELNNMYMKPKNATESETMRSYITQLRQELGDRLIEAAFDRDDAPATKWWLSFAKRQFLDISLSPPGTL